VRVWLYRTPLSFSITSATRPSVHRSVSKPLARGPANSAVSTSATCSSLRRGSRPARPEPASAARPPLLHRRYHSETASRETSNAATTSAWDLPRLNISAARILRRLKASKSRLLAAFFVFGILPLVAPDWGEVATLKFFHTDVVTSMYYRRLFKFNLSHSGLTFDGPSGDDNSWLFYEQVFNCLEDRAW